MPDPSGDGVDWAKASGDAWAKRWTDTDRGLESVHQHLVSAIAAQAPCGPFRALDIGCGPGSTSIAVADACPEASITACDISAALAQVARQRTARLQSIRVIAGDAEAVAADEGPFDIIFSRHGVMFFEDPVRAFGGFEAPRKKAPS
jgi:ubiquinone/menaquinone biosynthesis C-methylase UbiE